MPASKETKALALQIRELFAKSDEERDKDLPLQLPKVERINNLKYGPDQEWHLLDIYRPKGKSGKLPFIINFHGGGFVYGTKETYQHYGMYLAQDDFAFINISYRLAPSVEFPQELDDIHLAILWLVEHADTYQLDLENVFIVGDSAGGQMALQYIAILSNDQFRHLFGYEKPAIHLRAAAINCAGTFLYLPGAISGALEAYLPKEKQIAFANHLRTEEYLTRDCPPLFIMTSSHDFIRDNSVRLQGYLLAKNIYHEFHSYGNEENPRYHVFHCNVKDELAIKCNKEQLNFFRRYLK
ncbi:Acetyl esterase/lipase [Streptococcus henryi]|uniref:Acetyl esterase/lipase n=1 Tax=Streptococcus henryi TaxID=439219 RepID=A0A1G6ASI5_9STRE|nr:alpha/beta hydrolase [Streptococcus henryi]SDB11301.1 Acetyl esterase/lipase [Streptococcus henryi]